MLEEDIELSNFNRYIDMILKKHMHHNSVKCCPFCGTKKFIKYGKYSGVQRFKCKKCKKTFSLTTNTVWQYSKKSYKTWIEFIELLVEKQTLRYCASKLKINLATAFCWRHKILSALNSTENLKVLKGDVHVGKASVKENFKGCRNILTEERKNVIIIGGVDSQDTMIAGPVCRELWSYKDFNEKFYKRIEKGSYMIAYGDRYLLKIARDNNNDRLKICNEETRIKFFRKFVHLWFINFRGVATKYLSKYFSWFILDNLKKNIGWIRILEFMVDLITYIRSEDISKEGL